MFYALAIALCLAVLFLVLACSSLLLVPAMLLARRMVRAAAPENAANVLFAARLLPLILACVVTLGLALPAFLEFEPNSTNEGIGLQLDVLALAGAVLLAGMVVRGWRLLRATTQAQRAWRAKSERIYLHGVDLPTYRVESGSPLLAVAGIFRPQVFISREIAETLSPEELRAAVEHEIAHVTSFDNLKQVLLKITRPPRWLKAFHDADIEWDSASEIAADHNALSRGASVLDLSAALIKVGRLNRTRATTNAVASHLVPPGCGSSLEKRVMRLSELLQGAGQTDAHPVGRAKLFIAIALGLAAYVSCVHAFLPAVHEALEFLVR